MNTPDDQTARPESTPAVAPPQPEAPPAVAPPRPESESLEPRLRRLSRRGFACAGAAALAGLAGWRWLVTRSAEDELPWPLRRALEFNELLARGIFRASRRSPEFPRSAARMPRVNGSIGLDLGLDLSAWRLQVVGAAGDHARSFTLDDIKALPRVEMTTELRCIEGWS